MAYNQKSGRGNYPSSGASPQGFLARSIKKTLQKQAKDQRKDKYGKNDELLNL